MKAIKVTISAHEFLFPEGFDFPFPEYVIEHKEMIKHYIEAGDTMTELLIKHAGNYDHPDFNNVRNRIKLLKSELSEFKARTGVIGNPFDMRDVSLYIVANNVDVVSTISL